MNRSQRGEVLTLVLVLVAGVCLFVPTWHLPAIFQKKPETKQLSQANGALEKAQADAKLAEAALASAQAKEQAAQLVQIRYSQEMVSGVRLSLLSAPKSAETTLAGELASRADNALALAVGKLPADQQAEMEALIQNALSAKQAQVDAAQATLAQRDAQLQAVTQQKQALDIQVPVLQASVATKDALVAVAQTKVDAKQAEVISWADKTSAAQKEAGSLGAYGNNLMRILVICGIAYLFIHFVLPSLAQQYPASKVLSGVYLWLTSLFSAHSVSTSSSPAQPTKAP